MAPRDGEPCRWKDPPGDLFGKKASLARGEKMKNKACPKPEVWQKFQDVMFFAGRFFFGMIDVLGDGVG